ncbi:hypothetical protein E2C01_041937 [Portunus trituberculatus]|uniref:Uncharacterized protein n=1 Tax=Portunus trituberculatus TaxID=210409 RepID=A0A5B7FSC1_PORTR|nr:hypothetical protein [Portunus trituberculatus]
MFSRLASVAAEGHQPPHTALPSFYLAKSVNPLRPCRRGFTDDGIEHKDFVWANCGPLRVRGTPCMCCRLTRGGDGHEKRKTQRCVRVTAETVLSAALFVLCSVNKLQLGDQCFKLRPATTS